MNKYNIEVGDSAYWCKNEISYEIDLVTNEGFHFKVDGGNTPIWRFSDLESYIKEGNFVLVKMNRGKIIGYTLLKDTPDSKAGTIFNKTSEGYENAEDSEGYNSLYFDKYVENNTEWFSPIYEEVKPTEVYVDTLAGKVSVNKWRLQLNEEVLPIKAFEEVAYMVTRAKTILSGSPFKAFIETFKVGCKTFHISDIPKIQEAIKQVS